VVEPYLGGNVANLDFVGMVNSSMQIMHNNRLNFPSDLALLFRVFVQLQGLGSSVVPRSPSPNCSSPTGKR